MWNAQEKINKLMGLVTSVEMDELDCDECYGRVAEYAENLLLSRGYTEAMFAIQRHLEQCPCCRDEFDALMEGLRALPTLDEPS